MREAIQNANLILNSEKFWGMLFTFEGVKPDLEKVKALENIKPPKDKDKLRSFICMMLSYSDFISSFAKAVALLWKLNEEGFCWTHIHQKTFDEPLKMLSDH